MADPGENGNRERISGRKLTSAEVEELQPLAYELAIRRLSYREIGVELGINEKTAKRLIDLELERRRITHMRMVEGQIGTYDLIARDALALHRDLRRAGNDTAQNAVASLNAATAALTRIDILAGLEAPKKSEVSHSQIDPATLNEAQLKAISALADQAYAIAQGELPPGDEEDGYPGGEGAL